MAKIKITSSTLPDIYPTTNYQDKIYLNERPIRNGFTTEIIKTEEKHSTINDSWERERIIQSIMYDKYTFSFYAKENNSIELLKYSDVVNIEDLETGIVHRANIIDLASSKVSDTQILKFTITYADINPVNYKDYKQPTNSFLEREFLLANNDPSSLNGIGIGSSSEPIVFGSINEPFFYTAYTILNTKVDTSDAISKSTEVDGLKKTIKTISQTGHNMTFYCKEDEMNLLKKYLPYGNNPTFGILIFLSGVSYLTLEAINPIVRKVSGLVDLWEVKFFAKTQNNSKNHYN